MLMGERASTGGGGALRRKLGSSPLSRPASFNSAACLASDLANSRSVGLIVSCSNFVFCLLACLRRKNWVFGSLEGPSRPNNAPGALGLLCCQGAPYVGGFVRTDA